MPSIRQQFPPPYPGDEEVRLQAMVSQRDKRTILGGVGEDAIYTFIVQHAFRQAANFIRKHNVTPYEPTSVTAFLDFVRDGADSRATGSADSHNDSRTTPRVQHPDASASGVTVGGSKGSKGRSRKQGGE